MSKARGFWWGVLLMTLGVVLADLLADGIEAKSWWALGLLALTLSILNRFLKPLLILFALPFVVLTLGIGIWFINALLLYLAGTLLGDWVEVRSFASALWGSLIISLTAMLVNLLTSDRRRPAARFHLRPRGATPKPRDPNVIDV